MQPIFIDGIANITLVDGIVRIELLNLAYHEKDNSSPHQSATLALSLPALLRTHNMLSKAIDKMVEDGILKKTGSTEPKSIKDTSAEMIN